MRHCRFRLRMVASESQLVMPGSHFRSFDMKITMPCNNQTQSPPMSCLPAPTARDFYIIVYGFSALLKKPAKIILG